MLGKMSFFQFWPENMFFFQMKWGWPQLNSNHSSTTAKTTFPFHEGKKKMPCDEFPAAAHLVCDEDQQLTAEALEAARIAVNKQPGMMMFGTVSFGVFWGRLWRHMWCRKPYNICMYISFMPIRYAYMYIYILYASLWDVFQICLTKALHGRGGLACVFLRERGGCFLLGEIFLIVSWCSKGCQRQLLKGSKKYHPRSLRARPWK